MTWTRAVTRLPTAKVITERDAFARSWWIAQPSSVRRQSTRSVNWLGGRRRETKEGMDVGSLVGSGGRGRAQTKVEREAERSFNRGNTANNISTSGKANK